VLGNKDVRTQLDPTVDPPVDPTEGRRDAYDGRKVRR
jgi:hypothetical protein